MKDVIDTIINYWYVFAPLLVLVIVAITILIRKGYLRHINIFGIELDFKSVNEGEKNKKKEIKNKKKVDSADYYQDAKPTKRKTSFDEYKKTFTNAAAEDLRTYRLTEAEVLELVKGEFVNHLNYFYYDLQEYPLPVQKGFLIVLDKSNGKIVIRAIKQASRNEMELASWSAILGLYRKASRYQYRTERNYVFRRETIEYIVDEHFEILKRIARHLGVFKKVKKAEKRPTDFVVILNNLLDLELSKELSEEMLAEYQNSFPIEIKQLLFYISSSLISLKEAMKTVADLENGLIPQREGDAEIVLSLERSLQYIHKIILSTMD
ncbi:MAG: hypothetical protein ACOYZ6_14675 [Chloroflexota bacterium]